MNLWKYKPESFMKPPHFLLIEGISSERAFLTECLGFSSIVYYCSEFH
jgi:hypothetical protein